MLPPGSGCQNLCIWMNKVEVLTSLAFFSQSTTENNSYWSGRRKSPVSHIYWQWLMVGCQQATETITQQNLEIWTAATTQLVKMWFEAGWMAVTEWALGRIPKGGHPAAYPSSVYCVLAVVGPFWRRFSKGFFCFLFWHSTVQKDNAGTFSFPLSEFSPSSLKGLAD